MNGVSSVSRLLGCYHLWPHVIPAPSVESVELRAEDQYIVIATDGLWKNVTYEQVIHKIKTSLNPIQASKCLRDLAIAQGCKTDISVIVVQLNIDKTIPAQATALVKEKVAVEPEGSEDEEEDAAITNIDDVITDSEEEREKDDGVKHDRTLHQRKNKTSSMTSEEHGELDQLVLSAIHSPTSSPFKPTLESTNFDDPDESFTPPPVDASTQSELTNYAATNMMVLPEMAYEAQTLPSAAKQRKNSHEVTVNGGYAILGETSFEQTQVSGV